MNIKRVKQGAKITLYNGIYSVLLGIFYIFFVNLIMIMNFNSISRLWGFFIKYEPEISRLFYLLNINIGIFLIVIGIIIIYLSYFIYKRKEKMVWVILFISGIISWAGLLTITILMKNIVLIILSSIGWITFVFGMILPIRYYLEKEYREY